MQSHQGRHPWARRTLCRRTRTHNYWKLALGMAHSCLFISGFRTFNSDISERVSSRVQRRILPTCTTVTATSKKDAIFPAVPQHLDDTHMPCPLWYPMQSLIDHTLPSSILQILTESSVDRQSGDCAFKNPHYQRHPQMPFFLPFAVSGHVPSLQCVLSRFHASRSSNSQANLLRSRIRRHGRRGTAGR